jgi:ribonucleoside-diphosphate reductase alpha chain
MNFTDQACMIKKMKKAYRAKMVIVDGNGLGSGLVDELLKDSFDKITGEYLGCFDTINTDNKPQSQNAEKCLFDMKAQGYQTKVVSHFINSVDSGMLKMLMRRQEQDFTDKEREFFDRNVLPFLNTELLFFEIANLKLKIMSGNSLSVEKVVRKIDKDKFSACSYCIFYILEYCNQEKKKNTSFDPTTMIQFRQPQIRKY